MNESAYNDNRRRTDEDNSANSVSRKELRRTAPSDNKGLSFSGTVVFMLCLATTFTLLMVAAVIWLSELLGSTIWACLAAGGAAALLSLVIYLCSVRRTIRTLHEYMDTVYETSSMAKSGYEKVKEWIDYLF